MSEDICVGFGHSDFLFGFCCGTPVVSRLSLLWGWHFFEWSFMLCVQRSFSVKYFSARLGRPFLVATSEPGSQVGCDLSLHVATQLYFLQTD